MKCRRCGALIPDQEIICPKCGTEVQIVPDYNPLEDILASEVKGSVEGATRQIQTGEIRQIRQRQSTQSTRSTRVLNQNEVDRIREMKREQQRREGTTGGEERRIQQQERSKTPGVSRDTAQLRRENDERKRQQQLRRKAEAKKQRRNLLIGIFLFLACIGAGIYLVYQNSYPGIVKKGYEALVDQDYANAENYFFRAIGKDATETEAYEGLADVYIQQNDLESAEEVYLTGLSTQTSNVALYQCAITFYMEHDMQNRIPPLLEACESREVLKAVSEYLSDAPKFSLESGTYPEVQEVTITSSTGGTIYYTMDGTDPDSLSPVYTEPILINSEGSVELRAIVYNEKGIPSSITSAEYTIEFPIADAPVVSPTTGQHPASAQITITVPEGYTAYYTTDGSDPTAQSALYTEPVSMPENGQIIFKAVLVNNKNGKMTDITTRNYVTRAE